MMWLVVNPPRSSAIREISCHHTISTSEYRLAFKVKMSNEQYRVRPVYGFIDAKGKATLEIEGSSAPAREEKIVIEYLEVTAEEIDPKAPFKAHAQYGKVIIKIITKNDDDGNLKNEDHSLSVPKVTPPPAASPAPEAPAAPTPTFEKTSEKKEDEKDEKKSEKGGAEEKKSEKRKMLKTRRRVR